MSSIPRIKNYKNKVGWERRIEGQRQRQKETGGRRKRRGKTEEEKVELGKGRKKQGKKKVCIQSN